MTSDPHFGHHLCESGHTRSPTSSRSSSGLVALLKPDSFAPLTRRPGRRAKDARAFTLVGPSECDFDTPETALTNNGLPHRVAAPRPKAGVRDLEPIVALALLAYPQPGQGTSILRSRRPLGIRPSTVIELPLGIAPTAPYVAEPLHLLQIELGLEVVAVVALKPQKRQLGAFPGDAAPRPSTRRAHLGQPESLWWSVAAVFHSAQCIHHRESTTRLSPDGPAPHPSVVGGVGCGSIGCSPDDDASSTTARNKLAQVREQGVHSTPPGW